jgi:hypothetical protein
MEEELKIINAKLDYMKNKIKKIERYTVSDKILKTAIYFKVNMI